MRTKVTFLGAGSTVFAKNVCGDIMSTPSLCESEIALYDIDEQRLKDSIDLLEVINQKINGGKAKITGYLGVENRKQALKNANFAVNAIQVGGYDPCTITDFEIPKKFGLRQTIADTLGIGGIMRALRTIPVMEDFAQDMQEVCEDVWFLNYTNPMSMLAGYMQRYTSVKTVGLCHSVQACVPHLFNSLGMSYDESKIQSKIAGINHMAWLLEVKDENGNDQYPEIKKRINEKTEKHYDMVRYEYVKHLGYYCTESSEHNAEYNPWFIKSKYPELIDRFNIPLDEYIRRCEGAISEYNGRRGRFHELEEFTSHKRSNEYASYIMQAMVENKPYKIGGNVLNKGGLIENLPTDACVEVPCLVDNSGINPTYVGRLPVSLAAMNMTHINVHNCVLEAAKTKKREYIYHAVSLEPHTAAELSLDDMYKMTDEMIDMHKDYLPEYK